MPTEQELKSHPRTRYNVFGFKVWFQEGCNQFGIAIPNEAIGWNSDWDGVEIIMSSGYLTFCDTLTGLQNCN